MGKISDYAQALKSKLTDLFVVYQINNSELETKSVTTEQIGDAICGEQVHSSLETDDKTIIGGINELAKDKNIADEYDDTHTYNTGDITIYGNTLYICNTNNTTGDFDPSNWTATTIDNVIGSLSTLTTTDKSSLVGAVNSMIIKTNASWTANSSSAYGTTLTDSINVTKGVWLITWGHPSQSANLGCFVDGIATNSDITEQFMSLDNGLANTKGCILVRFTGNSTIKLCAGGSAAVTFSDIGRGFLRAVKLK